MTIQENKNGNPIATAATLMYIALWVLLVLFVTFDLKKPDTIGEGILINFGNTETGMGDEDLMDNDQLADAQSTPQSAAQSAVEEIVTQDVEEAPVVKPKPKEKPKPTQTPTTKPTTATKPAETPPTEQPRQVNKQALFPGRSNSNAKSEGEAGGSGNQGNLAGSPAGSHSGTGTGNSGVSYNLNGRSVVGALPKPDYSAKEEGRVIIEIKVNPQGDVTSASFKSVGSTTTNNVLVDAAIRAARRAKFNVDDSAPFPQIGTIVYNFRMN